ncbi:hypothetical protein [Singulisphaera sp. PoT]|uniref:hypothetical protein n=1 Tax=Singulisphaera sp. PoT TaxID=3411797 RepID=UPI003BF509A5
MKIEYDPITGSCMHDHVEDKKPAEYRESAYRRGVQQGWFTVIQILEAGGGLDEVREHYKRITDWRFRMGKYRSKDRAKIVWPPIPDLEAIRKKPSLSARPARPKTARPKAVRRSPKV